MNADEEDVLQTYVFEDVEVQKTGRKSQQTLPSGKIDIKYEITPVDTTVGTWKKWVRQNVLFVVS